MVCQGPLALTQRSPRMGRFAAMRVQPREEHRRRGLAQPPSLGRAKDEEELRARVCTGPEQTHISVPYRSWNSWMYKIENPPNTRLLD